MRRSAKWRTASRWETEWSPITCRQVEGSGGSHEVVRLGRGEPVVLVPGLAGGWKLLMPLARRLARRHEVHLVGLSGDGAILPRCSGVGVADEAKSLLQAIDRLGLERPGLVGVSYGGAVALELAVEAPGRFGSLVLSGAEAQFGRRWAATMARRVLERFPIPDDNPFINQFFNLLHGGKPEPGPLPDFVVRRIWETDQGVIADRLRALESFDASDRLWRVEAPTLVLAGSKDVVVPPDRQEALARSLSHSRFATIEGAGHLGFLSHRAEVSRRIARHVGVVRRAVS
ncbi:alpha/beta fold hydrolase [Tautonia plasticadhaerens]|uniref:Pimeloyl-[acyl-carrier protein] methyl ester esterase n=1 Tax=Tautonia plasticadhaerens TaxID=2527974 RepID=A0A518H0H7_9BACT|nr:alpha/beta hydrolase [Tautonia plasticadhaerens]QDV34333.1 Pimeloyl-[acyl-carrier protein] methyl ester esterase [Tautonia plasticadhaerens]